MRTVFIIAQWLFFCLVPVAIFGQTAKPQFSDYSVPKHYAGPRVAPKIKPNTAAWHFRTRIREAVQGKPNFAGHYILASWGCGAECLSTAIIDVKTGAVYFVDFTVCCWYNTPASAASATHSDAVDTLAPVDFRLSSKLIIFTGLLNEEGNKGPHYFKFEQGKLSALP